MKEGFQSHFFRKIGIVTFSKLLSIITKNTITDITSDFRAYNRKAIIFNDVALSLYKKLNFRQEGCLRKHVF